MLERFCKRKGNVSILILLEIALEGPRKCHSSASSIGFNPYSAGNCSGRGIYTTPASTPFIVSILILLEIALEAVFNN